MKFSNQHWVIGVSAVSLLMGGCASSRSTERSPRSESYSRQSSDSREVLVASNDAQAQDGHYNVTIDELRTRARDRSAVIVDARDPDDYRHGHVSGAVNVPAGPQMSTYRGSVLRDVAPTQMVIVYCASASCEAGDAVYDYLLKQGFTNVRVFKPGWRVLKDANI